MLMSEAYEDSDRVAITGMAGRFPGARDIGAFWANLVQGRSGVSFFSEEELLEAGAAPEGLHEDGFVPAKGYLEGADRFDAGFFGYSPREAEIMDPQHRVFLECAWEALESAGVVPHEFEGRIALYAGAGFNTYMLRNVLADDGTREAAGMYQTMLAGDKDFLATRAAYKLGLTGPAITVQTACSTSLTAVHLAVQSLLAGECDIALAGGVAVSSPLKDGHVHEPGGILSPDGHCRPFDAEAAGTVPGNGVGVVVLRRLGEVREAGGRVEALILGTAANNDGALKAGYTAPSVDGQAEVIAEALAVADVDPATIGYVEAHGTGTRLGDPIEVTALSRVFAEGRGAGEHAGSCTLGSVKSNVGHLDAAAGVTSLIKAVLTLRHGTIPPTLHFSSPNPELELEKSPFSVNSEVRAWPRGDAPRRAGVSSFGIGGTNVHVVLQEAPEEPESPAPRARGATVLPLSAKSPAAVAEAAHRLADHLEEHPDTDVDDVAATLAHGRRAFGVRTAVTCRDRAEAVAHLRRVSAADTVQADRDTSVAFLFPGQGAQYVGMARGLYEHEPAFAAQVDRCADLFAPYLGLDLRTLLFTAGESEQAAGLLEQTRITQPALFTVEYALARLWETWGVTPSAMIGHSVGEFVAACLAGVFSLEDAVRLVARRGHLVQAMPAGAMLSVFLPEEETAALLHGRLCVAGVNAVDVTAVSGPEEDIAALERQLKDRRVSCRKLRTSHAFHSPSMEAAVGPLVEEVRGIRLAAPRIPFHSNVTGTWITDEQATDPVYWGRQLRSPVRFADSAAVLLADPSLVFVEVGPGETLGALLRRHNGWTDGRTAVPSLRHPGDRVDDRVRLLRSLGALWSAGVAVDWAAFDPEGNRALDLPAYPFQRQRYWVEPRQGSEGARSPAASPSARPSADTWFRVPGWRRLPDAPVPGAAASGALWVVLGEDVALGSALAQRLEADGAEVVRVRAGDEYRAGGTHVELDPGSREHAAELFRLLEQRSPESVRLVHLFGLAGENGTERTLDGERLLDARSRGFAGLLALAQGVLDTRGDGRRVPVAIDVVCSGVYSVTGDERLRPEQAMMQGPATVIPHEVPDTRARILDLAEADPQRPTDQEAAALYAAVVRDSGHRDLALRGRYWWVREFDEIELDGGDGTDSTLRPRDGGVYLITGGLGGVGLTLAEQIAASADGVVLGLLGRSAFPDQADWDAPQADDATAERIRRVRALRDRGATVAVLTADVSDAEQTGAALERLRALGGPITGVVHAAGLPSSGMIAHKTLEEAERVMAAKTQGTLVLDRLCGDEAEFVLLCSSVTGVLGGPGQIDYCAANAFLDAYAAWRNRRGTGARAVSVAWDTWNGVGMAGRAPFLLSGADGGQPTSHPLLRLVQEAGGNRTYSASFSTSESWIVDDHRLMGHGLVPGTAYLDLAYAALAEEAGGREVELADILFLQPLIVPDGQVRTLYLTVEEDGEQRSFAVRSRSASGGAIDHAKGTARFAERGPRPVLDLAEELDKCEVTEVLSTPQEVNRRLRVEAYAKGNGSLEFRFGPRWQLLRSIRTGRRRMLAEMRLDEEFHGDVEEYPLHPALFDMAGGAFRIHAEHLYYLPLTYRSVRVLHPLPASVVCVVEMRESGDGETMSCDIDILDTDGRLLVRVADFTVKRVTDLDGLIEQVDLAVAEGGTDSAETDGDTAVLRALGEGMSEEEGREAFARITASAAPPEHLVVTPSDFAAKRMAFAALTPELLARGLEQLPSPAAAHPRPELDTPYVAPRTEDEEAIAGIWLAVLGVQDVGVNDDFFALGGHSLAAVQVGTRFQSLFGFELDLRDFFASPTVAHTAQLLAAAREGGGDAAPEDGAIRRLDRGDDPEDVDALSDEEVEARLAMLLAEEQEERHEQP